MRTPEQTGGTVESYYMGCWQQPGHYFWLPGMKRVTFRGSDNGPTPWGYKLDSSTYDTADFTLRKLDGWTAIGLEDRTVDSRPGSHSVFAFHADLTMDEAVALAQSTFPQVFKRIQHTGRGQDRG